MAQVSNHCKEFTGRTRNDLESERQVEDRRLFGDSTNTTRKLRPTDANPFENSLERYSQEISDPAPAYLSVL